MNGIIRRDIHQTAIVHENAMVAETVKIGANSIIYGNVVLGENVFVGPNSIIGEPISDFYHTSNYINPIVNIGNNALIRSGAIIYSGANIGVNFECGHRVTIREYTEIGMNCRVGTNSDLQGYCKLGDYVRIHSNVFISQKSKIGDFVWIFPHTVLTNDPYPPSDLIKSIILDDFSVIASKAVIMPGIKIGRDALVGAMSLVNRDVLPETVVFGVPAKERGMVRDIISKSSGDIMYPWRNHFDRGMPWEGIGYQNWLNGSSSD